MKIRTLLFLMFGGIVVSVLLILYVTNRATLDAPIVLGRDVWIPVWLALLLASVVSMLVPYRSCSAFCAICVACCGISASGARRAHARRRRSSTCAASSRC